MNYPDAESMGDRSPVYHSILRSFGLILVAPEAVRLIVESAARKQGASLTKPCAGWFAVFASAISGALVVSVWTLTFGLGAAERTAKEALFGLCGGAVCGLIFGGGNTLVLSDLFREDASSSLSARIDNLFNMQAGAAIRAGD